MTIPSENPYILFERNKWAALRVFVSDFLDFSIYIDANENLLEQWYISRFLKFREDNFADPKSFFHKYTKLTDDEATRLAGNIWCEINRANFRNNIVPTRKRASLILHKSDNNTVGFVRLRK